MKNQFHIGQMGSLLVCVLIYAALSGDERWRRFTPRILLSHTSGLANFAFLEPDEKMRIHFDPGTRYAYSGEGLILLQFVLETGLRLNVGEEMQRRVFDRFGMGRTSMMWREDFAANLADGYRIDGAFEAHDERSRPRAAGSMDTTIADFAKFVAGFARGEGISKQSRAEMIKPQVAIHTPAQFPTFLDSTSPAMRAIKLSAGLGVVTFQSRFGRAFFGSEQESEMTQCSRGFLEDDEFSLRRGHALGLEQQIAQVGIAPASP